MKVLIITSEWPNESRPFAVPFLVREIEYIKKLGVNVDVFSFKGRKKLYNYFLSWRKVRRIINNKKYDLIHVHWGYNAILAIPVKVPIIITYRGDDLNGITYINGIANYFKSFALIYCSKMMSYFASTIILVTDTFKVKLNKKIPSYIIPSGIDLNIFKPINKNFCREKINLSLDKKIILFPANKTDEVKNYNLALEVFSIVKNTINNVDLITIPMNTDMEKIPYYMNSADCILFTSLQEGSPNVIKEALACNIPVVSTNVGDVESRLKNIEGCIVCNNYDSEIIATSVIKTLDHYNKVNGRKNIEQLGIDKTANKIVSIYKQLSKGIK